MLRSKLSTALSSTKEYIRNLYATFSKKQEREISELVEDILEDSDDYGDEGICCHRKKTTQRDLTQAFFLAYQQYFGIPQRA